MAIGDRLPINDKDFISKRITMTAWAFDNNAHMEDKGEYWEIVENDPIDPKELLRQEWSTLQTYLNETDYMVVKCAERGLSMEETYPEDYVKRQQARDRINEIKKELGDSALSFMTTEIADYEDENEDEYEDELDENEDELDE